MRRLWAVGAAIVMCLALGGLPAAGQEASPGGVTREVLYEITVPAGAIPVGLEKIPVDQWTVDAGVDAVIPLDNEAVRGRGCLVRSGTFVVTPATDALQWRAADAVGGSPTLAPAGDPVTLAAGDVLLLPAVADAEVDPAAEVGLANPGSDEAVVFCFHLHQPGGQFPGWPDGFTSTLGVTHSERADMAATEAGDAIFRLTRLVAPVGGAIALPEDVAYAFYIADAGRIKSSAGGPARSAGAGLSLSARTDPPLQLVVAGEEPATVLELAVIPSAEPAPSAEPSTAPASAPPAVAAATPIMMDCVETVACTMTSEAPLGRFSGCVNSCTLTADDPRLSGEMTVRPECDWADPATGSFIGAACWGTWELVGPDGTWAGSLVSTEPGGGAAALILVAQGTGAYEGWTVVANLLGDGSGDPTQEGDAFVYQGPPPRWPALPSSVSE